MKTNETIQNPCSTKKLAVLLRTFLLLAVLLAFVPKPVRAASNQKVTVYFNGKGGKISFKQKTVEYKKAIGELPMAKASGYKFNGWYTKKGNRVTTRTKVVVKGSITLYAKWTPTSYKVSFAANGVIKNVPASFNIKRGYAIKLPSCKEKNFGSWNTKADGSGTSYAPGTIVRNFAPKSGRKVTFYASPFRGKNNIAKIYDYFQRLGYTKAAAAGLVGNLMYESGGGYKDVKLNAVEYSTGRGIGMCQWTDTYDAKRRTAFVKYCASQGEKWPNQNLKVQVDFLLKEITGRQWMFTGFPGYSKKAKMTLKQFKACKNVALATEAFCANFERPRYIHANLKERIKMAKYVMKNY